ncbi:hypothetical protein D9756_006401 [Leucocoprinus leucothites]|uniref:Mismatched base pair and cruciform DNA recognition protein n=1 Tax=Leucocoprinus leucothites TaxID=201217 RepID=A0A8H5LGU6_9AGAR|nr:hypothetical protein D9756_006401 [Leucoagaricus leucothites]
MSTTNNNDAATKSASNTASGDPSKVSGQYHSVKGTVVESIGDLTGASSWKQSGKEEHAAGEAEYNAAQAKAYGEATADRISGKKDAILGAVTGNREQELQGNARQDKGQAQQKVNNPF